MTTVKQAYPSAYRKKKHNYKRETFRYQTAAKHIVDDLILRLSKIISGVYYKSDSLSRWVMNTVPYAREDVTEALEAACFSIEDVKQELYVIYYLRPEQSSRSFIWRCINWTKQLCKKYAYRVEEERYRNWLYGDGYYEYTLDTIAGNAFTIKNVAKGKLVCLDNLDHKEKYTLFLISKGHSTSEIGSVLLTPIRTIQHRLKQLRPVMKDRLTKGDNGTYVN